MAKKRSKLARRARIAVRRSGVAVHKAARHARRTASAHKAEFVTPAIAAVTAGAVGYLDAPDRDKDAFKLPTVAGIMPEALIGGVLGVLGTMVGPTTKGMVGKAVRGAATGLVSVAAYKLGSGQKLMSDEKTGEDDESGYDDD